MNKTKIAVHQGTCSNCYSNGEVSWVTCYRLPINLKCWGYQELEFKTGQHLDVCLTCLAKEFEKKRVINEIRC